MGKIENLSCKRPHNLTINTMVKLIMIILFPRKKLTLFAGPTRWYALMNSVSTLWFNSTFVKELSESVIYYFFYIHVDYVGYVCSDEVPFFVGAK
jgi:prepilin signal peptidase PulO-like enzyme (type II secretory pathway)